MMFRNICLIVLISFAFVSGADLGPNSKDKLKNKVPGSTNNEEAVAPSSTQAPTTEPTEITVTSNVSDKPVTTTPTPVTTTVVPSSSSSTPATTPVTTTSVPSTTTSPTTPKPSPKPVPIWTVADINGTICIQMNASAEIEVSIKDGTSEKTYKVEVPSNATANGSCTADKQIMKIWWEGSNQTGGSPKLNCLTFNFTKESSQYFINDVNLIAYLSIEKNSTDVTTVNVSYSGQLFVTSIDNSYICASPEDVKLSGSNMTAVLKMNSLHYEAFAHANKTSGFSSPQDCLADSVPDIVPIIVAGALILLVLGVFLAYIINRRRTQARGYLSM